MTIDKAQLKALAEAATPGPWHAENDRHEGSINADYRHIGMVSMFCRVREDVERNFANQRFIAAANPATTLALLAEIERLELIGRISCNFDGYKAVLDERDQLKAENEALRKDAERYRWIRTADWWRSPVCAISNPKEQAKLGSDCPSGERLDAQIDAAMAKEASHG